jgi:mono/diheme cytochrome c family protein
MVARCPPTGAPAARAAGKDAEPPITYENHIAAILKKNCATCHGDGKQEAGLNLVSIPA